MDKGWALAAIAVAAAGPAAAQTPSPTDPNGDDRKVVVRVGEQITREDNLYRLPDGIDPSLVVGPDASRDDTINSTSVALLGHWMQSQQEIVLDTALAANRFAENDDLDYTSGHGALDWNWKLGGPWSGLLEARHEQTLASFANTSSLEKDVFSTSGYRAEVRFAIGPRWSAIAGGRLATTSHDNEARRGDDADIEDTSLGAEYRTPRDSTLGFEARRSRATYPDGALLPEGGSASDYQDQRATVTLGYEPAQKVAIKASVGYVERTYLHAQGGDFSGGVWSATVQWTPSTKAQFALQSWRDLKAYLDAESNHFVSTGESLLAAWLPIAQINLTLQVSHEDQHYIGEELLQFFPDREDKPTTASLQFTYKLRQRAEFNVLYRSEARDSNSFRFDYDAATVSVGGEVKF